MLLNGRVFANKSKNHGIAMQSRSVTLRRMPWKKQSRKSQNEACLKLA
jgi:hypothetical protein